MSAFSNWLGNIKMFRTVESVKQDIDKLVTELYDIRDRSYRVAEERNGVILLLQDEVKRHYGEAANAETIASKLKTL